MGNFRPRWQKSLSGLALTLPFWYLSCIGICVSVYLCICVPVYLFQHLVCVHL